MAKLLYNSLTQVLPEFITVNENLTQPTQTALIYW